MYALNAQGNPARNFVTMNTIPIEHAVRIGGHVFDARSLRDFFRETSNPRNPYTRQPFPEEVLRRYKAQINARKRNNQKSINLKAERTRLMLAYNNVLNELRDATAKRYRRTLSRQRSR